MRLDLNVSRDGAIFTWSGRLFHAVGPDTENELSPNLVVDRGTCSRPLADDLNLLYAIGMQKSAMYSGMRLCNDLYVIRQSLY